jgi:hypothetical protein
MIETQTAWFRLLIGVRGAVGDPSPNAVKASWNCMKKSVRLDVAPMVRHS